MAKSKGKRKQSNWSHSDHTSARLHKASKLAKKASLKNLPPPTSYKREALQHDTTDKISLKKTHMNLAILKKKWEDSYNLITSFDSVTYEKSLSEKRLKAQSDLAHSLKSQKARRVISKNLDPSQWKLKGPARPANEVYDFDKRYVDKHAVEISTHLSSQSRKVNLLKSGDGTAPVEVEYYKLMDAYVLELFELDYLKTVKKMFNKGMRIQQKLRYEIEVGDIPEARKYVDCEEGRWAEVLFEFVSLGLEEEGSGEDVLEKCFETAVERDEEMGWRLGFLEGGWLKRVWEETEGAIEWLREKLGERGFEGEEGEGGWKEEIRKVWEEEIGEAEEVEEAEEGGGEESEDTEN
ncbi:hypothetical protein TrVE_jg8613 [Triparma verrucosa]|uniref:Uncharacterized protein n=1 Tax=Triparma verrucosa TaxID=1606542 RepID=A0A9W7FGN0_9STRA|nr:hypothetical protein TrVE_jg8613 [Triparma verrucosa]